jgi:hypothetical protein
MAMSASNISTLALPLCPVPLGSWQGFPENDANVDGDPHTDFDEYQSLSRKDQGVANRDT